MRQTRWSSSPSPGCRRCRQGGPPNPRSPGCTSTISTEACPPTSTDGQLPAAMPASECAPLILEAFADYNAQFRLITRRAPGRFDARDARGSQRDAVERIELYDRLVSQTIVQLRLRLGERALERALWAAIRNEFATLIGGLPDAEFTKTFFSSITRRLHGTVGVAPEIEFVATDLDPLGTINTKVGTNTYINHGSLLLLFEDVLGDVRFHSAWRDFDRSVAHVTSEVTRYLM